MLVLLVAVAAGTVASPLAGTVTGTVTGGVAVPAAQARAATCYPVAARFHARWAEDAGGYGCATGDEVTYYNGTRQNFERGQMVWSPSQGSGMVVSGMRYTYRDNGVLRSGRYFKWGSSSPFHYDYWLWRIAPLHGIQWQCGTHGGSCGRSVGWWNLDNADMHGYYGITVEGCDDGGILGKDCNQGWTNYVYA